MATLNDDGPRVKRQRTDSFEPAEPDASAQTDDSMFFPMGPSGLLDEHASANELGEEIGRMQEFLRSAVKELQHTLSPDMTRRLKAVISLATGTVVRLAVSGPSGAGKSSLLNALLEEDDILPTGGWGKACTPVPIEISYNTDPEYPYRAEIDYITEADWRADIEIAQCAISDGETTTQNAANPVDKVTSAYPRFTAELKDKTVDEVLQSSQEIRELLGKQTRLKHEDRKSFEQDFRHRMIPKSGNVASKAKTWPLVQSARLYLRSPLLKDGLVLVDVPGVGDSNRARGGRAREYLQTCSAVCIVAPGIRAGSDSTFLDHLEDVLHVVQYGNRLDRLVVITSKADEYPKNIIKDTSDEKLKLLHSQKEAAKSAYRDIKHQIETHTFLLEEEKQKLVTFTSEARAWKSKKTRLQNDPGREMRLKSTGGKKVKGELVTMEMATAKVNEYEAAKAQAAGNIEDAKTNITDGRPLLESKRAELTQATALYNESLLRYVVQSSKESLSEGFAKKVNDYMAEIEAEADPNADTRELPQRPAQDPPIFCVSANRYLQLKGLDDCDDAADGATSDIFVTEDDTGVPALRTHLSTVFVAARRDLLRSVYHQMVTELVSLDIHLFRDFESQKVDPADAARAIAEATRLLASVKEAFSERLCAAETAITGLFHTHFTARKPAVAQDATQALRTCMARWPMNKATGRGLRYQTYRAAVVRKGVWEEGPYSVNFNRWAERRVVNRLAGVVDALFTADAAVVKAELAACCRALVAVVETLHAAVRAKAVNAGVPAYAVEKIDQQLVNRRGRIRELFRGAKGETSTVHGVPCLHVNTDIKAAWEAGYEEAKRRSRGLGALLAMNDALAAAVRADRVVRLALEGLEDRLNEALAEVIRRLCEDVAGVAHGMVGDYERALEKADANAVVTKDPRVNEVRSRMIVLGYASAEKGGDGVKRERSLSPASFIRLTAVEGG